MLQGLNTGPPGSQTTLHANSPGGAIRLGHAQGVELARLEFGCRASGAAGRFECCRDPAGAVNPTHRLAHAGPQSIRAQAPRRQSRACGGRLHPPGYLELVTSEGDGADRHAAG